MTEADVNRRLLAALGELGLEEGELEALAAQLIWRIGRVSDEAPVTVRVGFAGSAALFADLPRLRTASEEEIEAALGDGSLRVEWVGHRHVG